MKSNLKFFKNLKLCQLINFLEMFLYDKKLVTTLSESVWRKRRFYYISKISNLFSEIIAIGLFNWEIFGKPKNFNIIELGPGDGSLIKVLITVF